MLRVFATFAVASSWSLAISAPNAVDALKLNMLHAHVKGDTATEEEDTKHAEHKKVKKSDDDKQDEHHGDYDADEHSGSSSLPKKHSGHQKKSHSGHVHHGRDDDHDFFEVSPAAPKPSPRDNHHHRSTHSLLHPHHGARTRTPPSLMHSGGADHESEEGEDKDNNSIVVPKKVFYVLTALLVAMFIFQLVTMVTVNGNSSAISSGNNFQESQHEWQHRYLAKAPISGTS